MGNPNSLLDGVNVRAGGVVSDHMDYWRQYRGMEIEVRECQVCSLEGEEGFLRELFLVRGEVAGVLDSPAALLLEGVEEVHRSLEYGGDGEVESRERCVRRVEEKVVAFSEMEEVELVDGGEG